MEPTVSDRPEYLEDDAAVQLEADIEGIIVEWIGMKPQLAGLHAKLIVQGSRGISRSRPCSTVETSRK